MQMLKYAAAIISCFRSTITIKNCYIDMRLKINERKQQELTIRLQMFEIILVIIDASHG